MAKRRKTKNAKEKSDIEQMAELIAGESSDFEEAVDTEAKSEAVKPAEAEAESEAAKPEAESEAVKSAETEAKSEAVMSAETDTATGETVATVAATGVSEAESVQSSDAEKALKKTRRKKREKEIKQAPERKEKKRPVKEVDEYRRAEIKQYVKYAISGVVAIALIAVCGVTIAVNREAKRAGTGEVLKLTDVSEGLMPFSGITFSAEPISYEDMKNKNYTSARLEEIEAENERIDKILAERQAQREKKEKESEKATKVIEATGISQYDPDDRRIIIPKTTTRISTSYSYSGSLNPRTQITYADANGKYEDCGNFILTAYCPCPICCGQWSNMVDPHTASGAPAIAGVTVAVDPKVFPYGTKLMINGQIYTAQDCGGAIIGNHIDIYFNTHQEACNFGRQEAHVYRVIE